MNLNVTEQTIQPPPVTTLVAEKTYLTYDQMRQIITGLIQSGLVSATILVTPEMLKKMVIEQESVQGASPDGSQTIWTPMFGITTELNPPA